MGLLARWDRRNQQAAERERAEDPTRGGGARFVRAWLTVVAIFGTGQAVRAATEGWTWWPGRGLVLLATAAVLAALLALIDRLVTRRPPP